MNTRLRRRKLWEERGGRQQRRQRAARCWSYWRRHDEGSGSGEGRDMDRQRLPDSEGVEGVKSEGRETGPSLCFNCLL